MTWWLAVLFFQQPQMLDLPTQTVNPYTSASDLAQGKRLYAGRCAGCHGPEGNGGKGANLAVPSLSRAQTDIGLYRVIRYGLPETEMPGSLMAQREIWQVGAFVRTLGGVGASQITGDAVRGKALVAGKGGCLNCHRIGAEGGNYGPPLTDTGRQRSPAYLSTKLLDPAASMADDFRSVETTTRDGRKLSGIRVNEDTWSIQLRDSSGSLHSLWKQDTVSLQVHRKTPMPSYRAVFSNDELNNVVAYLARLGGAE